MKYHVQRGDCLIKIAGDHGFSDFRTIYDHPENADFRKKRPNPNVILAGDELFIPDVSEAAPFQCETGNSHTFVIPDPVKAFLSLHVRIGRKPLANKEYELQVDAEPLKGRTDADGLVYQEIPFAATRGVLRFRSENLIFDLRIGDLDPASEPQGIRQRLQHLGFRCEDDDGLPDAMLEDALRAFQIEYGLPATGILDDATRSSLLREHDKGVES